MTGDEELKKFVDFSLSYFEVSNLEVPPNVTNDQITENVTYCRYDDYRNPPWHTDPYSHSMIYWQIFSARLAFVVIYQVGNLLVYLQISIEISFYLR